LIQNQINTEEIYCRDKTFQEKKQFRDPNCVSFFCRVAEAGGVEGLRSSICTAPHFVSVFAEWRRVEERAQVWQLYTAPHFVSVFAEWRRVVERAQV
jgi:hypothetical protein